MLPLPDELYRNKESSEMYSSPRLNKGDTKSVALITSICLNLVVTSCSNKRTFSLVTSSADKTWIPVYLARYSIYFDY